MCGLAGVLELTGSAASEELLRTMGGDLRHRGPDGVGLLLDGGVGIVSTRLAVVDLAGGDQPLSNEDGRIWALQNGELYNYVELRDDLRRLGHVFASDSDTEVIAHGYEEWGPGLLERINGDFAIAVWDTRSRELFLARDRFGVRPLFLARDGDGLAFASEVRALLRRPGVGRALDPRGLMDAISLWGIAPGRSAFAGVRELPPAHWLRAKEDGTLELQRWWDLDCPPAADSLRQVDLDDAADELLEVLRDSLRLRQRADVPVATYLSGGVDSSVIAALAAARNPDHLQAFGVAFPGTPYDEGEAQRMVAGALHVRLEQLDIREDEIAAWFRRAVELAEQPLLRTAPAPMLALSHHVRGHGHKVVLTGEGADELFAGYDIFKEAKVRRFWAREPESTARPLLLGRVHRHLDRDLATTGLVGRRFFARGLEDTGDPLYSHVPRFANGERLSRLLAEAPLDGWTVDDARADLVERLPASFAAGSPLARAQAVERTTFLQGMLLHAQGDRMLMGHGVEGRYPYLDHRVATLAARLPDALKLNGLADKLVLRRVARRLLPAGADRPKQPYRAPIAAALAGPSAPEWAQELLQPARVAATGVLDVDVVQRVAARARRGDGVGLGEIDAMALAAALSIVVLDECLVKSPPAASPVTPDRAVRLTVSEAAA